MTPLQTLCQHVTGAIERGEKTAIVEQRETCRPWCIVMDPGTDDEYVESTQHRTRAEAQHWVDEARKSGYAADVMKRLPDGSLTTEF